MLSPTREHSGASWRESRGCALSEDIELVCSANGSYVDGADGLPPKSGTTDQLTIYFERKGERLRRCPRRIVPYPHALR